VVAISIAIAMSPPCRISYSAEVGVIGVVYGASEVHGVPRWQDGDVGAGDHPEGGADGEGWREAEVAGDGDVRCSAELPGDVLDVGLQLLPGRWRLGPPFGVGVGPSKRSTQSMACAACAARRPARVAMDTIVRVGPARSLRC